LFFLYSESLKKLEPKDEFPHQTILFATLFIFYMICTTAHKKLWIGDTSILMRNASASNEAKRNMEKNKLEEDVKVNYQELVDLREEFAKLTAPKRQET
jgi:hypothetical protein